jgi:hypothetical protein
MDEIFAVIDWSDLPQSIPAAGGEPPPRDPLDDIEIPEV